MTDPQGAAQRLRDFLNAATPQLPDNHAFCRIGDADNRPLLAGGYPLLLGDIKHAIDQADARQQVIKRMARESLAAEAAVERIRDKATEWTRLAPADDWGMTPTDTVLADAGRYLLALIDQPERVRPQTCAHAAGCHGPEAGCVECRCTSTTGHP